MKAKISIIKKRCGGIGVLIVLAILILALIVGFYLKGRLNQQRQQALLAEGYEHFNAQSYQAAFEKFSQARNTFSSTLSLYRVINSAANHVTSDELVELIVSTCLVAAHQKFFVIETADEWVSRAKEYIAHINESERKTATLALVKTAADISDLCRDFSDGKVLEALKNLKKVEDEALPSDQDFFIFEIRFLIACGKALNEPLILNQARELLFFATTDAGIEDERTQKLWGILRR
jgi:hypothetical protein